MNDVKPVSIISDNPELESVKFGYDAYARTIAGIIANKKNKTPLVIGVYGSWGSGKTTLMKAVIDILRSKPLEDKQQYRKAKTVWFQAWKYGDGNEILAALIEEIFKAIKRDSLWGKIKADIEEFIIKTDVMQGVRKIAEHFIGTDVFSFMKEMEYKEKLGFYDTFQEFFDRLLWIYLNNRPKNNNDEQVNDTDGVLAIFIDDLDRCPNQNILKVLETVKLFMDKAGCVFILGAASEIIEKALKENYGDDACKFMDKIVQVTFNLPLIQADTLKELLDGLEIEHKEKIMESLTILAPVLENNPRQVKRFLNNLNLQQGIIQNKKINIDFEALLNWSIIEYVYPSLAKITKGNPQNLLMLKESISKTENLFDGDATRELGEDALKEVPRALRSYVSDNGLRQVMKNFKCDKECILQLVSLSGIVEIKEEKSFKVEKDLQQGLDEMVKIPAGKFLYGDEKETSEIKTPYSIDVYLVTNLQYEKFIKAGGYVKDEYWCNEGKEWKKKSENTLPKHWTDEKWNKPDHPVVGVSWYEADAYARWAGKRLPTEQEWERAARGTDGRKYPWRNDFDKERCNSKESGIGHTTAVKQYSNGISPEGCYDMAGNVWEWTCTNYDSRKEQENFKNDETPVLRGGSWNRDSDICRCAMRRIIDSQFRNYNLGFRCARISF
jgi:formylglycine-generating enzyme required for sulfatase activity